MCLLLPRVELVDGHVGPHTGADQAVSADPLLEPSMTVAFTDDSSAHSSAPPAWLVDQAAEHA
jgi:hypothetical protein